MVNILILIVPAIILSTVSGNLDVLYEWKYIDYLWKTPEQKQAAIDCGDYNHTLIFAIDVDRASDGRYFVTTPRDRGVPASLSTVSNKMGDGGRLLKPYPDWSWYENKERCTGITSVFRVTIACNKLWVLDTGNVGNDQICSAQILVFDLSNNKLLKRITIPSDKSSNSENGKGLLITPVVESSGPHCDIDHTRVYMADVDGYGLIVWNGENEQLQRFSDTSFNADPQNVNFTIENESFELADGLFALALQPRIHGSHSRRLFYRPFASLRQSYVSTRHFHGHFGDAMTPNYKTLSYTFPAQVSVEAFSSEGILFMGYTNPSAIACWNSHKEMNDKNVVIVAQDSETLQFTSGLKIRGEKLLALTNRFQKIMAGTQNFDEVNFRILVEPNIQNLVRDTTCELGH